MPANPTDKAALLEAEAPVSTAAVTEHTPAPVEPEPVAPSAEEPAADPIQELRKAALDARQAAIAGLDKILSELPPTQQVRELGALRSDLAHLRAFLAQGLK
jgi:hypothetical protein